MTKPRLHLGNNKTLFSPCNSFTWDGKTCSDEKNIPFRNSTHFSPSWCPESPPKISKSGHYGILRKGLFRFFCLLRTIFFIFGPFWAVFWGGSNFLVSRHHGGHHISILIFGLFHFLAIFGRFRIFGAFLHFKVVLGELVSYKITRGIREGHLGGLGGF